MARRRGLRRRRDRDSRRCSRRSRRLARLSRHVVERRRDPAPPSVGMGSWRCRDPRPDSRPSGASPCSAPLGSARACARRPACTAAGCCWSPSASPWFPPLSSRERSRAATSTATACSSTSSPSRPPSSSTPFSFRSGRGRLLLEWCGSPRLSALGALAAGGLATAYQQAATTVLAGAIPDRARHRSRARSRKRHLLPVPPAGDVAHRRAALP